MTSLSCMCAGFNHTSVTPRILHLRGFVLFVLFFQQRRSFTPTWRTGGPLMERGWLSWSLTTVWCPTWLYLASPA